MALDRTIDRAFGIRFPASKFYCALGRNIIFAYALLMKHRRGKKVKIICNGNTQAGYYLAQSGMISFFDDHHNDLNIESDDKIAKLTQVKKSSEIPYFVSRVMEILSIDDEEVSGAVKYSLVELLRNVIQHSNSPFGGIAMAHYYPATGLVDVVVADCGVGIQNTLNNKYPEIDKDFKAIKFATQPHVSGTFKPGAYSEMNENAGLGLFFYQADCKSFWWGIFSWLR